MARIATRRQAAGMEPGAVRIIAGEEDIAAGVAHLAAACDIMGRIIPLSGPIPLRRREAGFEGLCAIVVSQQLSVASAGAIWARTKAVFDPLTPDKILRASDADFIAAGLSRPKQRALRAIAEAVSSDALPLSTLHRRDAGEIRAAMVAVKGIGPWTADIFALFCLGHADAFAAGDLALREAARMAFKLRKRPDEKKLLKLAQRWSPWRGVAARVLWAYYAQQKKREGVT